MPRPMTFDGAVLREMTDPEYAQHQADRTANATRVAAEAVERVSRAATKSAVMTRLAITNDELKALLS